MNKIIWLTGHSGSGKSTIGFPLAKELNAIVLDGDEMRESISIGAGFSREERREHNLRIARLARELSKQMNVIVTVIAPMKEVRDEITNICNPIWIWINREVPFKEGHFYEAGDYFQVSKDEVNENVKDIIKYVGGGFKFSLFIGRWQPLHKGHLALFDKVRKEGRKILIGIRRTALDENNPYTVYDRIKMIHDKVPDAEYVIIPDIEEIVIGRKVGYGIREIKLEEEIEKISATDIRNGKA